jgi:hypothetical protein
MMRITWAVYGRPISRREANMDQGFANLPGLAVLVNGELWFCVDYARSLLEEAGRAHRSWLDR